MGRRLNKARVEMVARHYFGELVDVGIGCGSFVDARRAAGYPTLGYDINLTGVRWLEARNLFCNPYLGCDAASFWDSFEHILRYPDAVFPVRKYIFMSLPIFRDARHAVASKHFRPTEHYWYWTYDGLVKAMRGLKFELVEDNTIETRIGREDIGSFAFRRM
jgi:hypothetical protein